MAVRTGHHSACASVGGLQCRYFVTKHLQLVTPPNLSEVVLFAAADEIDKEALSFFLKNFMRGSS